MKNQMILIVEDSKAQQAVIESLVKNFGFDVHTVSSAEDALEAVKAVQFAAILMDIVLPKMNGFECTRQIREAAAGRNCHVPIIAVSATVIDEKFERTARASGMNDFLAKPFESEALRKVLLRHTYAPQFPNLRLLPTRAPQSFPGANLR